MFSTLNNKALEQDSDGGKIHFIEKLWNIVNRCSSGAIKWNNKGTAILIKYKSFEKEFLAQLSTAGKPIDAFINQLLMHGFKQTFHGKVTPSSQSNIGGRFIHKFFTRDGTDLKKMVDQTSKESKSMDKGSRYRKWSNLKERPQKYLKKSASAERAASVVDTVEKEAGNGMSMSLWNPCDPEVFASDEIDKISSTNFILPILRKANANIQDKPEITLNDLLSSGAVGALIDSDLYIY